jgi:NAD(P)-dependent dehydrogenase (short-subunit alcohol dehydrogenase family)
MDLSQAKHAFITGGASGIGLGIADALASRGLSITIVDIDKETLAEIVGTRGNQFRGIHLDTRDRERWAAAKEEAESVFGPVDVLCNNAGIAPNGRTFAEMSPESFDIILQINLVGIVNGVFAFAPDMKARGRGHIVNTSSQAGLTASMPGVGAYCVAKFGVTALSECLRAEMAEHGVGVSVLCPSLVHTNLAANTAKVGGEVRESAPMMKSDVTPAHVGEFVAQGIERNEPYILTHAGIWPAIAPRCEALKAACEIRDRDSTEQVLL